MVRLKGGSHRASLDGPASFQFHMVRLKGDETVRRALQGNTISIPYGAIKSMVLRSTIFLYNNFNSIWCD